MWHVSISLRLSPLRHYTTQCSGDKRPSARMYRAITNAWKIRKRRRSGRHTARPLRKLRFCIFVLFLFISIFFFFFISFRSFSYSPQFLNRSEIRLDIYLCARVCVCVSANALISFTGTHSVAVSRLLLPCGMCALHAFGRTDTNVASTTVCCKHRVCTLVDVVRSPN